MYHRYIRTNHQWCQLGQLGYELVYLYIIKVSYLQIPLCTSRHDIVGVHTLHKPFIHARAHAYPHTLHKPFIHARAHAYPHTLHYTLLYSTHYTTLYTTHTLHYTHTTRTLNTYATPKCSCWITIAITFCAVQQ